MNSPMIAFGIRRSRENKVLDLYLSPISPLSMVSDWMQEANVTPLQSLDLILQESLIY